MATRTDRLFEEVNRQLAAVAAQADGVATRAGLLISAAALAAGLLGTRLASAHSKGLTIAALIALGVSALLGIGVAAPPTTAGPTVTQLGTWASAQNAAAIIQDLYAAKLLTLEANRSRLTIIRTVFYLQVVAVVTALVLTLLAAGA